MVAVPTGQKLGCLQRTERAAGGIRATSEEERPRAEGWAAAPRSKALWCGLAVVLVARPAWAQPSLTPQTIKLDALTCQELLSRPGEHRDRLLTYLNGYLDSQQGATTWEECLAGERIDRVVAACKSKPDALLLRVFTDAWSR
jgi:hypothetical protein